MKFTSAVMALAIVTAPGLAYAAADNISGTYAIRYTTLCQAYAGSPGTISQTIGIIEFIPGTTGALNGSIKASLTQSGGNLVVNGSSPNFSTYTDPSPVGGTYSLTTGSTVFSPSTISITFGPDAPVTFTAYLSALKSGVYDHADFSNIDTISATAPNCATYGGIDLSSSSITN